MLEDTADRFHLPQRRSVRLDTLLRLRWLAILGQTTAVLVVYYSIEFPLPIWACLAVIALSVWLNIALRIRFRLTQRLEPERAAWLLAFDIAELAVLLFLTGGLENPFSFLFLAPVLLSATALPPRITVILGAFAIVCATALVFVHYPLPWDPDDPLELPWIYLLGVWFCILLAIGFIGVYAWQITEESRQIAEALAATELVLSREQHLSQLDGLAAAAAHELGTPLSTISVVVRELERTLEAGSPHLDDVRLLREQSQRCRDILSKLTELSAGEPFDLIPLSALIEEVVAPHRNFGIAINVALARDPAPPMGARNPAILYGLGNLLENAVDFAQDRVEVIADWTAADVSVTISDDGPGFAPEIMDRIGEPYVHSSKRRRMNGGSETTGLGLGFFIAKTLLERSGATIACENRAYPDRGAVIRINWERNDFERPWSLPALEKPSQLAYSPRTMSLAMIDSPHEIGQTERTLLIVEDDKSFLLRLARAMEARGFVVATAESVGDGLQQVEMSAPAFAVVDMRLGDGNGVDVIVALKQRRPDARAIILTGYGNIATAVNAVKIGAVDYLSKPADADDVVAALLALEGRKAEPPEHPMSADRVRWEHIQRIYELCGRNVSETARRLNMHRRTLQRILAKRAPR